MKSTGDRELDRELKERTDFEESNYVRVTLSKAQKKKMKQAALNMQRGRKIDDFDEYDDEDVEWWDDTLDDETGGFIYQAAEEVGLEEFWFEDGGYVGAHTPTEFGYTKNGINYKAECDYEDTDVHSVEEAVDLLKGLDWKRA